MTAQPPVGYCQCGCGERTNLAKQSHTALGRVKGEPFRYINGHNRRARVEPPNPSGLCECGCGEKTDIAANTHLGYGRVKGQRHRFVHGHQGRKPGIRLAARTAWEESEVEYGFCLCGCGEKTKVAVETDTSRGQVRGEPNRYLSGHDHIDPVPPWRGDEAATARVPWIAGFFEGEGSIAIRGPAGGGHRSAAMYVVVVTTEPELLDPFLAFGGSIRRYAAGDPRWKPSYRWQVGSRAAAAFLTAIRPHIVSERNVARIALALEFQSGKRNRGRGGRLTATEIVRELEQWNAMKELNRRGAQ